MKKPLPDRPPAWAGRAHNKELRQGISPDSRNSVQEERAEHPQTTKQPERAPKINRKSHRKVSGNRGNRHNNRKITDSYPNNASHRCQSDSTSNTVSRSSATS